MLTKQDVNYETQTVNLLMDEYSSGMDPELKIYFKKIIKSLMTAFLWLLGMGTAGFLYKLAIIKNGWHWYNALFYLVAVITLIWVNVFLYRLWRKR